MDLEIAKKVVLITGSTRGIGLAIAKKFYSEGCRVIINSRNLDEVKKIALTIGKDVKAIACDVSNPLESNRFMSEIKSFWGRLDILICNVGNGSMIPSGRESFDDWQKSFNINFYSATNVIKSTTKLLEQSKGSIVCISSICGMEILGAPLPYSVAKKALNVFVRGSSRYLGKKGIRINAVIPGNILFPGSIWEQKIKNDKSKIKQMIKSEVSLNRFGRANEIADFVVFLASPRASFCTGSYIVVDGGQVRSV